MAPTSVRVRVPATSANLGPAFDCAGLALACYDELEFGVAAAGLSVEVTGVGAGELPTDESHLVLRAFRAACAELGWSPMGLRLVAANQIPQGRGLGSSAAAVLAGVLGAWALCPDVDVDGPAERAAVLRLADRIEGHPDNVAACQLGGATLSWTTADGARAVRLTVDDRVTAVVFVPTTTLSTQLARGLLPGVVPHADAAHAAGRAALLVQALTRNPALLFEATEDRLHQGYRAAAMPDSAALLARLRADGRAAVISGAGPTVLVLGTRAAGDDPPAPAPELAAATPPGWLCLARGIDTAGAQVLADPHAVWS